ncbi:MAG: MlaD family protein [Bacteroidota bacterium]|nr:MlaD family protein [Bacteroidota bacterium]
MKEFSKEIVVGLIAVITILLFIWLFSFLKGYNLFKSSDRYYAVFNEIGGLEESAPVEINGYKAGIVRNIKFINDGSGRLLITIGVNSEYKLPLGTIAEITPETVLAGMKVQLILGESTAYHLNGDTIESRLNRGIINTLSDGLSPILSKADRIISDIDTLVNTIKPFLTDDLSKDIHESSKNIKSISYRMDTLLEGSGENISSLIANLDNFTGMLHKNSEVLDTTIRQLSGIASELSESEIEKAVDNFNAAVDETTILLQKLNEGKGSAGLLLNDDSLYTKLTISLEQLNLLLEDLKSNPERYVNFSLFGRKKNK